MISIYFCVQYTFFSSREYKEFLKQQRAQESIYKGKIQNNDNNFDQKVSFHCVVKCVIFNWFTLNKQDIRPYIKPTTPEIISTPVNNLSLPMTPSQNVWSKNNTQVTKNKLQFTMKREYDKAREEAELLKQLRDVRI